MSTKLRHLAVDFETGDVSVEWVDGGTATAAIGSPEGFALLSRAWLRSGWDAKYVYGFSWLGRPIIQLPEDIVRLQELITEVAPDVVLETGIAHGGSLVLHASVLNALGRGRVIGVDVEIRPHNRAAIEAHPLSEMITLIEGDSTAAETVERVRSLIARDETVMVLLDSAHSRDHVRAELEAYAPFVGRGSYLVVMDAIMEQVAGAPRTGDDWTWNHPGTAVADFLATHEEFESCEPARPFNEGAIQERVTYFPAGIIRRR